MQEADLQAFQKLPPSSLCRIINFEHAEVRPGIIPKTFFLIVTGHKPWLTMAVELVPLIYIVQPDYWGIEVIGCQRGIGLPVQAPYSVALDISHVHGKYGIEVIGANKRQQIKVP